MKKFLTILFCFLFLAGCAGMTSSANDQEIPESDYGSSALQDLDNN